jgi:pimeloyl-ACP methyl ester carboxylesterase
VLTSAGKAPIRRLEVQRRSQTRRWVLSLLLALGLGSSADAAERVTHFAHVNGISIAYQEAGNPAGVPVLLVIGLNGQLVLWSDAFVDGIAGAGYRVLLFDCRDAGLSEKFYRESDPSLFWAFVRQRLGFGAGSVYSLDDMASDTVGLMDHLGIDSAHVVGRSMGGMIAQLVALGYPDRTRSLVSMASTTGAEGLPEADPEVMKFLSGDQPVDRDGAVERAVAARTALAGKTHPPDPDAVRRLAAQAYDRSHYPPGMRRRILAILDAPSRAEPLEGLQVPTLVVHGTEDPLIPPAHGEDTAARIPGARLLLVEGMGHALPEPLLPEVLGAIVEFLGKIDAQRMSN